MEVGRIAADLRGDAQADPALPHLGEADRAVAAIDLVLHVPFPAANLLERPAQVAVPLQGVHAQVEMHVEDQCRLVHGARQAEIQSD